MIAFGRCVAGALAGLFLAGAIGSLAAPNAGLAQALGVCVGGTILGALLATDARGSD